MNTLQTLKGFRDFLPADAIIRKKIIQKIVSVFEKFGYDPLETPALEYAETLLGKYGEDTDKLLYIFEDRGGRKVGLRYDQTVPLARIAAQYQDIPKPFKRYQIQPVWRAENTQKGRYREFLQCDGDIIGDTYAPTADAEILSLLWNIYSEIGFTNIKIVVNSRQILKKLIDSSLNQDVEMRQFLSIVRSLDKLDKIEAKGVSAELKTKGLTDEQIKYMFDRIKEWSAYDYKKIEGLNGSLAWSIQMATENFKVPAERIIFNPTLARGLDYYTGIIFESVQDGINGSLGGGGRYDNLINQFVGRQISAVGFAIGFDRTLEAAKELKLIDDEPTVTKVLVAYKDNNNDVFPTALNVTTKLREAGINAEIYLDPKKELEKQLKYADKKGVGFVVIIGENEIKSGKYKLKNLQSGDQKELTIEEIISVIYT